MQLLSRPQALHLPPIHALLHAWCCTCKHLQCITPAGLTLEPATTLCKSYGDSLDIPNGLPSSGPSQSLRDLASLQLQLLFQLLDKSGAQHIPRSTSHHTTPHHTRPANQAPGPDSSRHAAQPCQQVLLQSCHAKRD